MRRPKPIRRVHIPLSGRMYVTAVIWRNEPDLYAGTTALEGSEKRDYHSIFGKEKSGNCVGRIHLHRGYLGVGTIGHEVRHAVDWYHHRLHEELLAELTDRCIEMIYEAAEDLPLAP